MSTNVPADVIVVVTHRGRHDEAVMAAASALDDVIRWYVRDGYEDSDILGRVEDAIENARDYEDDTA